MHKGRLEAFSDGVIAIIITIMVLELKAPAYDASPAALRPLVPVFLSYVLSFIYVGIYWNNHHHMLQASQHVNGRILWANLHLLFWLSLVPFVTDWLGESHFAAWPAAMYGVIMLLAGCAYEILSRSLIQHHGRESTLARATRNSWKGMASLGLYAVAIPVALLWPWVACAIYAIVAVIWIVPDRRIEKQISTAT
jgi:uncharacterized membrane protein